MTIAPDAPLPLLGGLTPAAFMRRYWQRKPLLIRQAIPGLKPPISTAALKKLAKRDDVESRLIWRERQQWQMEPGPFARLPKANEPDWTLLVQSADLHDDAVCELMQRFRFVPDARLDDAMISIATTGGGVGPHFDSYDVFLLQAAGRRRWRYGAQKDLSLQPGLPLKILSRFEPEHDHVLEPGDMLYLPPQAAHDGIALDDDCMTISIGFRAPTLAALASGLLEHAAEHVGVKGLGQAAVAHPAELPQAMIEAALASLGKLRLDEALAARFLGCWLTEPNAISVFAPSDDAPDLAARWPARGRIVLDRASRMLYRGRQLFINGEAAPVPVAPALRVLADERALDCSNPLCGKLSADAIDSLAEWLAAGWLHYAAN
jgi:50S ribosomal protein L16 3-hydroxylase